MEPVALTQLYVGLDELDKQLHSEALKRSERRQRSYRRHRNGWLAVAVVEVVLAILYPFIGGQWWLPLVVAAFALAIARIDQKGINREREFMKDLHLLLIDGLAVESDLFPWYGRDE